jgi:hypothetical protein
MPEAPQEVSSWFSVLFGVAEPGRWFSEAVEQPILCYSAHGEGEASLCQSRITAKPRSDYLRSLYSFLY